MKNKLHFFLLGILILCFMVAYMGCNKDERTITGPNSSVPTYSVTITVLGPTGVPQGGVTLTLQNPPYVSPIFTTITDSLGRGTIQVPSGNQTIIATIGTVFQVTVNVTVTSTPIVISTPIQLVQNTTLGKTLVIYADCENIETVLADTNIGYTKFDHTTVYDMRTQVDQDSVALLNYLKQYVIVFSDCNCGDEYEYPKLARLYGRYVQQGGKIYGGHYNYMNLQYIFAPSYNDNSQVYGSGSQLKIVNTNLSTALGYTVIDWPSSWYTQFSEIPVGNSTVYAVIDGSTGSPSSPLGIPIIVENRLGAGKYVWTTYHNQDILGDPRLIRIVRYFLYNM
ncbi:MAG: hypothetical protein ABR936_14260 [Bacteroidota bacterium]|jgi:hypothetical protein